MSNEGFRGVPGVPEGWELVHANRIADAGEYVLVSDGVPFLRATRSSLMFPIIRKIETPKRFRPFANGAEFATDERDRVGVDWKEGGTNGFYAVVSANASFVWVAFGDKIERFVWGEAFHKLRFRHADGSTSPFGVEVAE